MSHTKPTLSITELKRENARLKMQVTHWKRRVADIEAKLGLTLPVLALNFKGKPVRLIVHDGAPLAQAADVLEYISGATKRYKGRKGPGYIDRLRNIGLGAREAIGLRSDNLAERFGTTRMHLCHVLGRSTKTSDLGFVTALGI